MKMTTIVYYKDIPNWQSYGHHGWCIHRGEFGCGLSGRWVAEGGFASKAAAEEHARDRGW